MASVVKRFTPPAFLKDTIDQLFYPSTYFIKMSCLTGIKFLQLKVQSIQIQVNTNKTHQFLKSLILF